MGTKDKNQPKSIPGISLGINIAVGMAFFTIFGNWIDQKLGDKHVWIIVGLLFGLLYIGYEVWKLIRQSHEGPSNESNSKST